MHACQHVLRFKHLTGRCVNPNTDRGHIGTICVIGLVLVTNLVLPDSPHLSIQLFLHRLRMSTSQAISVIQRRSNTSCGGGGSTPRLGASQSSLGVAHGVPSELGRAGGSHGGRLQQQLDSGDEESVHEEESQVGPYVAPGIVGGVVVTGRTMEEEDLFSFSSDATEAFNKDQTKNGNAQPPSTHKQVLHDIETYVAYGLE